MLDHSDDVVVQVLLGRKLRATGTLPGGTNTGSSGSDAACAAKLEAVASTQWTPTSPRPPSRFGASGTGGEEDKLLPGIAWGGARTKPGGAGAAVSTVHRSSQSVPSEPAGSFWMH